MNLPFSSDIKAFMACAESKSFLEAADKLGTQQSTLSKTIKKIEHEHKKILFYRGPRGIQLSDFGMGLYKALLKSKNYWEIAYFEELQKGEQFAGNFSIGLHNSIALNELYKFLPQLQNKYPLTQFQIELDNSVHITKKVSEYKIDFGLVINPVKNSELVVKNLYKDYAYLFSSHSQASEFLIYNPQMYSQAKILKEFPDKKLLEISDYEVIASLICRSQHVGVLPLSVGKRYQLNPIGKKLLTVNLSGIYNKFRFKKSPKKKILDDIYSFIYQAQ